MISRDEFKKDLNLIFNPYWQYSDREISMALVENDTEKLDKIRLDKSKCDMECEKYLTEWDRAPTDKDKEAVVNSVKKGI